MKIAANLSHLWPELPYLDRFEAAAEAGFDGVEVLFPYDCPAKETQRALLRSGMAMVLMNAPPPNYTGGSPGFAATEGGQARFHSDLRRALRYAEALRVPMLHVMTGEGVGAPARATLVENLKAAAQTVPEGMVLTLEPLNAQAMPGYFMNDYALAADVLAEVDAPNIGLQFDSYHAQMIHGDAVSVFESYRPLIRHIQIGDAPDRGVPGNGEIDFAALFAAIRDSSYSGWISAEYTPGATTEEGLDWVQMLRTP